MENEIDNEQKVQSAENMAEKAHNSDNMMPESTQNDFDKSFDDENNESFNTISKGKINPKNKGDIVKKPIARVLSILASVWIVVLTAFLIMLMITTKVYQSATVIGSSMYPTINAVADGSEDKNDIAYYTMYKSAKVNDIIIVDYYDAGVSGTRKVDAIKRLIATGGDTICYYGGTLLRNGKPIDDWYMQNAREYISKNGQDGQDWSNNGYQTSKTNFNNFCQNLLLDMCSYDTTFVQQCKNDAEFKNSHIRYDVALSTYVLTIPENYIFFLGDNRGGSTDCSYFGPLEQKYLLAKVDFILSYNNNVFAKLYQQFTHIFA